MIAGFEAAWAFFGGVWLSPAPPADLSVIPTSSRCAVFSGGRHDYAVYVSFGHSSALYAARGTALSGVESSRGSPTFSPRSRATA